MNKYMNNKDATSVEAFKIPKRTNSKPQLLTQPTKLLVRTKRNRKKKLAHWKNWAFSRVSANTIKSINLIKNST